jgi:hypothetical protein
MTYFSPSAIAEPAKSDIAAIEAAARKRVEMRMLVLSVGDRMTIFFLCGGGPDGALPSNALPNIQSVSPNIATGIAALLCAANDDQMNIGTPPHSYRVNAAVPKRRGTDSTVFSFGTPVCVPHQTRQRTRRREEVIKRSPYGNEIQIVCQCGLSAAVPVARDASGTCVCGGSKRRAGRHDTAGDHRQLRGRAGSRAVVAPESRQIAPVVAQEAAPVVAQEAAPVVAQEAAPEVAQDAPTDEELLKKRRKQPEAQEQQQAPAEAPAKQPEPAAEPQAQQQEAPAEKPRAQPEPAAEQPSQQQEAPVEKPRKKREPACRTAGGRATCTAGGSSREAAQEARTCSRAAGGRTARYRAAGTAGDPGREAAQEAG